MVPVNVLTRSMLQKQNYILEERDTASIAQSQKKKKTRRKRSQKAAKSDPSSKTNIGTGDDPVYMNDAEEDSDSGETMETKTTTKIETNKEDLHEPQWPGSKKKIGTYPNPTEEIQRVKQLRSLVEDTQRDLEPAPRQIQITDTVFPTQQQPHQVHRPLAIPSVIQEESDLKSWESGRTHFLMERMFTEGLPDPIEEMEIPSSPRQGTQGQKGAVKHCQIDGFHVFRS
ncbi:hypothetical protein DD576_29605 [Klebsiella pneumoniae]|nr:hypothetical protein DD576_29605 [Klebsiella pneumoniae]